MGVILLCNRELHTAIRSWDYIILLCYKGVHAVNGRVMLYFALQTVYVYTHAKVGVLLVLGYYSLHIHTYWRKIGDTFG